MILDLHRQGLSVSDIDRRAGLDRKTVRKYITRGLEPPADKPRKRAVEVQVLAGEVRIYEGDALVAAHPVLEGSGRRQIAAGTGAWHRQPTAKRRGQGPRPFRPLLAQATQ